MKKATTKKTVSAKKTKKAVKESPILTEVKQLYSFMQDNHLDTIEYDQKGLYVRLVKSKPAVVPVPVAVGAGAAMAGGEAGVAIPTQEQYKEVLKA
ncbi:MAG: hypothetical protein IKP96_05750, partial [Elusimicrobiaceae bacterium]|nr:hypothetical protein [Elusimicrobiaceae bacterium]